jgi:hypothetical protein
MPKLSYLPLTRFDAIGALVDLYLQDPAFRSALEKLRSEHKLMLRKLAADITEWRSIVPRARQHVWNSPNWFLIPTRPR